MASFFRRRIAQKVLSMLQRKQELRMPSSPNLVASLIMVNKHKSPEPQLILLWKRLEQVCDQPISVNPNDLVRLLRNQGLPTAEGFVDIQLSESPLSVVFSVDKHIFSKIVLLDIFTNEDDLAKSSCLFEDIKKENIVVQCSVPSIGEVCYLSHFRTLIHTSYVTNINKFVGHSVSKIAHVNDWGPNAATFLTGFKQFKTSEIVERKSGDHLLEIYKAAIFDYKNDFKFKMNSDACYEKMKQGDKQILFEWQNLKQMCMNYYGSIYKRIGVQFDEFYFDSACCQKAEEISDHLSDVIFNKDGSRMHFEELGDDNYINVISDVESALYDLSRYISAATEMKEKYNFDKMYYICPSSQKDFLSAVFYMMKKLNYAWVDDLQQVILQQISSFDPKRRKKQSIETVLDQVKDVFITQLNKTWQMELNESLEEMAEHLSLSSLIVNDMKQNRKVDYEFDMKDLISFKQGSAASLQLCSAGLKGLQEDSEYKFKTDIDTSPLLEPQAHYLIKHLARFDETVFESYIRHEPYIIFQYLSTLWYYTDLVTNILKLDIKSDRLIVIKARLLLLSATLKVLNKGLHILGITPLEKVYSPEEAFLQNK